MATVFEHAVVIDSGGRVDDHVTADDASRAYYSAGSNKGSVADHNPSGDYSTGVNYPRELEPLCLNQQSQRQPRRTITETEHQFANATGSNLRQEVSTSQHARTGERSGRRVTVVHESEDLIISSQPDCVSYYCCVPRGSPNYQIKTAHIVCLKCYGRHYRCGSSEMVFQVNTGRTTPTHSPYQSPRPLPASVTSKPKTESTFSIETAIFLTNITCTR